MRLLPLRVSWMKEIKGELKFNGQILRMVLVVGMVGVRKKSNFNNICFINFFFICILAKKT